MIQTGQGKLNEGFFQDDNGLWTLRTRSQISGASDNTLIGNAKDRLKVEVTYPSDFTTTANGSLRISSSENVFDSLFSYDKQPLIWDELTANGGSSVHNANSRTVDISATGTLGSKVESQSVRRIRYNPSRTCQIFMGHILGAGDSVYGVEYLGRFYFVHRIINNGVPPFFRNSHLPARFEMENLTGTATGATVKAKGFCVRNEGGDKVYQGQLKSYSAFPTKTVTNVNTAVSSIRLKSGYEKAIVDLVTANIYVKTNDEVYWSIVLGATLTGATWATQPTGAYVEFDNRATSYTGGTELASGILGPGQNGVVLAGDLLREINSHLGTRLSGERVPLTLVARGRIWNADILYNCVWREYP